MNPTVVTAKQLAEVIVECARWDSDVPMYQLAGAFRYAVFNPNGSLASCEYDPPHPDSRPMRSALPLTGCLSIINQDLNVTYFEGVSQLFVDAVVILVNERPRRVFLGPRLRKRAPYKRTRHVMGYFRRDAIAPNVANPKLTTVPAEPEGMPLIFPDSDGGVVCWPSCAAV
jgi:hypothetical protein